MIKYMNHNNMNEIKILGAGISGLSAGITLARNGYRVNIYEKSSFPGARFIRDFQGLRNYGFNQKDPMKEFSELGINIKYIRKIFRVIRFSPSHKIEVFSSEKPLLYLLLRGNFPDSIDAQLARQAEAFEVNIEYNKTCLDERATIIATGPENIDVLVYGLIYDNVDYYKDKKMAETSFVFLDNRYAPKGYLYVLPGEYPGEMEIITNCDAHCGISHQQLKEIYYHAIERSQFLNYLINGANIKNEVWGTACRGMLPSNAFTNHKYYIGEAAGIQDPAAGFGIRYAILSGYLAATAIITNTNYNDLLRKIIGEEIMISYKRAEHLRKLTNSEIDRIFEQIISKVGNIISLEMYEQFRGII